MHVCVYIHTYIFGTRARVAQARVRGCCDKLPRHIGPVRGIHKRFRHIIDRHKSPGSHSKQYKHIHKSQHQLTLPPAQRASFSLNHSRLQWVLLPLFLHVRVQPRPHRASTARAKT